MSIEIGPANAHLTVHTGRAGMAARAGHDLILEPERWSASLDLAAGSVTAKIDANSLRVREGMGGVKPLSDKDKADIEKTMAEKILKTSQYPEITYESSSSSGLGGPQWQIDGRLTLCGVTMPVQIPVTAKPSGDEMVLEASIRILQSQFGIKPYSGMMGALKVADEVEIRAEARIPTSELPQQ
ncbi:MAG: YceI family protein [Solirubrobacteraceae bacterium]